jgi:hypothetical protein
VSAAKAFHVKMSIDRKKNEIKIFFRVWMGEKKSVVGGGYLFITFQKRGELEPFWLIIRKEPDGNI